MSRKFNEAVEISFVNLIDGTSPWSAGGVGGQKTPIGAGTFFVSESSNKM